jgi:glycosyltransferase involved in cell wall biosynthesis
MKQRKKSDSITYEPINSLPENFIYLYSSMWLPGVIGEDRKNTGLLVKLFFELFKNKKNPPALMLKTSTVSASYTDREVILKKINDIKQTVIANTLPNVYLLHGEFTDQDMNDLYNHPKIKCMINLTKGEGWNRGLCEFSLVNKPIITTGWSGQLDYLKPEFTALLTGTLTPIHSSAANNMLLKEASWFSADVQQASNLILDMFDNYKKYAELAKRQGYHTRNNFSFENMKDKLKSILNAIPTPVKQVSLQLPSLKKIEQ